MASGSQNMTTYYAKRVIGDASAAQANSALLQTGEDVAVNTWILNRTNRATTYGIKYVYDDTDGHDKVEFYGGAAAASAWVQLDTGDITAHKFIGALEGNADTATALTSNAGGTEQPIYFIGGKPAATSYALKATVNNGTAAYLAYYSGARAISSWSAAKFHDGCLSLFPTSSNYREGLRIHAVSNWSDITLCGTDLTGDTGISANSWFIGNNNGNFYIARNGSPGSTAYIGCVSNVWKFVTSADIPEGATNLSGTATAHTLSIYRNGITIPYQMDNANDGGMIRVRGTSETTTIFELGTWDDSGSGETIQFNYYPTTSQVTPTYSVSVPKHSGTLVTTDGNGASGTWGISITGSSASCTGNAANVTGTVAIGHGGTGATTAANARNNLGLGSIATYGAATAGTKDTWGLVPVIGASDGVMEVGKYIDFHVTDGNTKDYDVRITAETTGLTIGGTTTGTFKGNVTGNCSGSSGSCTGNAATATKLAHTTLDSTTINNTAGSFAFSGSGDPWSGSDWVGLQIGDNADKFQISARSNTLQFRQNDSGGTNTSWSDWVTMLTSANYTSYTVTKTGSGASGTWGISITGNAATATRINGNLAAATSNVNRNIWVSSGAGADGIPNYISYFNMNPSTNVFSVPAGTRISPNTGALYLGNSGNQNWVYVQDMCGQDGQKWKIHQNGNAEFTGTVTAPTFKAGNDNATYSSDRCKVYAANGTVGIHSSTNRGLYEFTDTKWIIYLQNSDDTVRSGYKIYGAVWNDFAEMREGDITEGGYAVYDDGHGHMKLCTERLQPGARLTSDTFGIVVGHTETAKTPIGVAGRVLVYPAQDRRNYKVGDAVCAAPCGKVDLMTREEIMMYPERILGIVSEIPDYEVWNQRYKAEEEKEYTETNIPVNGRIWIYVR